MLLSPSHAEAFLDLKGMFVNDGPRQLVERRAEGIGSPFTRNLFRNYKIMVTDVNGNYNLSHKATTHFYRKAAIASEGDVVMPEPLHTWNVDYDSGLVPAYRELKELFDFGAREFAPIIAARAQFYYDCWVMRSVGHASGKIPQVCRDRFQIAFSDLQHRMTMFKPNPQVRKPSVDAVDPLMQEEPEQQDASNQPSDLLDLLPEASGETPTVAVEDAKFLVFFDFDSSNIDETAGRVLNSVAEQINGRDDLKAVITIGHTDTRGTDRYNKRLSFRRAGAVREALIERDVDADLLKIRAMGETTPLVKTSDNVKEPANRRVEITFE